MVEQIRILSTCVQTHTRARTAMPSTIKGHVYTVTLHLGALPTSRQTPLCLLTAGLHLSGHKEVSIWSQLPVKVVKGFKPHVVTDRCCSYKESSQRTYNPPFYTLFSSSRQAVLKQHCTDACTRERCNYANYMYLYTYVLTIDRVTSIILYF